MPYRIYRRKGSDNLWLDIKIKGRRRIRRSSGTPSRQKAEQLAQSIEAAEWNRLIKGDPAALTFAEAVLIYVDDGHDARFTVPLVEHFRDMRVNQIGPGHIRAAARTIYPNAKAATWNRQVIVPARAVINHAASKGLAQWIRVERFAEMRAVRKAPAADWLPAFMSAAQPNYAALALFLRVTAARIGQAMAIDWQAVDLQRGIAVIPPAKKHPEREAILTVELVAMLANLPTRSGPVFGITDRRGFYREWKATCERAGIAYVGTHSAGRRAFATTMQRANIDPKTAAKRGGWKSVRLMLDIYTDADERPELIEQVFGTNESQSITGKSLNRPKKIGKTR